MTAENELMEYRDHHIAFPGFEIAKCGRLIMKLTKGELPSGVRSTCPECLKYDRAKLCTELSKADGGLTECNGYIREAGLACPRTSQHTLPCLDCRKELMDKTGFVAGAQYAYYGTPKVGNRPVCDNCHRRRLEAARCPRCGEPDGGHCPACTA